MSNLRALVLGMLLGLFIVLVAWQWMDYKPDKGGEPGRCIDNGHAVVFSDRIERGWEYTAQC